VLLGPEITDADLEELNRLAAVAETAAQAKAAFIRARATTREYAAWHLLRVAEEEAGQ
jgi:hypothetical protein